MILPTVAESKPESDLIAGGCLGLTAGSIRRGLGATLIELLVVVGLLGILMGLFLPAVQQMRAAASRAECSNKMKQLGVALHNFHSAFRRFPPSTSTQPPNSHPDASLSWMGLILPYIGETPMWLQAERACRSGARPTLNPPHVGYASPLVSYVCSDDSRLVAPLRTPSGDTAAFASYIGISGSFRGLSPLPGVLGNTPGIGITSITDGTSQTIMVGERPPPSSLQAGRWYTGRIRLERFAGPDEVIRIPLPKNASDLECALAGSAFGPGRLDNPCDRNHLWSLHPGGANFLFADGAVRFISYSQSDIIPALATYRNGEVTTLPD